MKSLRASFRPIGDYNKFSDMTASYLKIDRIFHGYLHLRTFAIAKATGTLQNLCVTTISTFLITHSVIMNLNSNSFGYSKEDNLELAFNALSKLENI